MIVDCIDLIVIVRAANRVSKYSEEEDDDVEEKEEEAEAEAEAEKIACCFQRRARRRIAALANKAVSAFLAAELTHRRQFGISREKNPAPVS